MPIRQMSLLRLLVFLAPFAASCVLAAEHTPVTTQERMVERTFTSHKSYNDPFNDVDVDVIFSRGQQSWRVPTFWKGGQRWAVRFAPPEPGKYDYHLESTDPSNPDLNGHPGHVTITPYTGNNSLLKHGMLRVSASRRYLEHVDGTPFYWLGDTAWMGLSDRLPWAGFKELTADRKAKGFTVLQVVAGLVPYEEQCPQDPGCGNEGGPVWEPGFTRINPGYFDAADRRIQLLVDSQIVPEIEGTWHTIIDQMGVAKMTKHWRYIVARYSAYPVIWNLADEIFDPPPAIAKQVPQEMRHMLSSPGWTQIARYVRSTDAIHNPITINAADLPLDIPLQDETLTDLDQLQAGHFGWPSLGNEVMAVDQHYARKDLIKPVVVGEIGYELHGATHFADFQRMAFWLGMLNGAAGHTYGAGPTYETNNPDKPLHRTQYTFLTWREGMNLPGSYELGLSSKLLRQYQWWLFKPHPEWVVPRGTTLLEPHDGPVFDVSDFDFRLLENDDQTLTDEYSRSPEAFFPGGQWKKANGNFRRPYAAGIPGRTRVVYIPALGVIESPPPTILALESGIRYHAYYWDPILGIKFDLGNVSVPTPGAIEFQETFASTHESRWLERGRAHAQVLQGKLTSTTNTVSLVNALSKQDCVIGVDALSNSSAGLVLRYQDPDNYVRAMFSEKDRNMYLTVRLRGVNKGKLGVTPIAMLDKDVRLTAEVRGNWGEVSITDGTHAYSTPIVDISGEDPALVPDLGKIKSGALGLWHEDDGNVQEFGAFEVRSSPSIPTDKQLERELYDARGIYRGELSGPGWDDWGRSKAILLNAYRPERFPTNQDWVLVLEAL